MVAVAEAADEISRIEAALPPATLPADAAAEEAPPPGPERREKPSPQLRIPRPQSLPIATSNDFPCILSPDCLPISHWVPFPKFVAFSNSEIGLDFTPILISF